MSKNYIITNIDPVLWKDFKTACAFYEISIKELFVNHMKAIIKDHKRAMADLSVRYYEHKKGEKP